MEILLAVAYTRRRVCIAISSYIFVSLSLSLSVDKDKGTWAPPSMPLSASRPSAAATISSSSLLYVYIYSPILAISFLVLILQRARSFAVFFILTKLLLQPSIPYISLYYCLIYIYIQYKHNTSYTSCFNYITLWQSCYAWSFFYYWWIDLSIIVITITIINCWR